VAIDLGPSGSIGGAGLGRSNVSTSVDLLDLLELRTPWMRDGLCREHPDVSFYAELGESLEPARAVCGNCLVRDECLDHTLEHQERYGLWGGKSPRERQAMRRLRRAS
jgi:WhiB family redox-sensing transcriptional regulator